MNPGYEHFYRKLNSNFGNYFRNLYRIIKQIDDFKFDEDPKKNFEKKYYYTSIVRAQLSDSEVKWMMFNSLTHYGEKFKPLIEKYSLLKILSNNNLSAISEYRQLYDKRAFDNRLK